MDGKSSELYYQHEEEWAETDPPDLPPTEEKTETLLDGHLSKAKAALIVFVGGLATVAALYFLGWLLFTQVIHINIIHDPTPISITVQPAVPGGAVSAVTVTPAPNLNARNLGPLPDDLCLVNGRPYLVTAQGGDRYSLASLTYIDTSGSLVVVTYTNGVFDLNKSAYRWDAHLCPSDKPENSR
jgi:hypothetical protein